MGRFQTSGDCDVAQRIKFDEFTLLEGDQFRLSELADSISYDAFEYIDQLAAGGDTAAMPTRPSVARKTTKRKRSYEQRKAPVAHSRRLLQEEIDTLARQTKALEAKLDYLKHRAGVHDLQSISQQTINNGMLRELLRNQQYLIAGLKSCLAGNRSEHAISPISTTIRLGRDPIQRRATLQAMRYQKLHDATRFMEKRTQFNSPITRFSECTQLQDEHGHMLSSSLNIYPLHLAKSVKQVYDAVLFNWFNLEIGIADLFGDVAVREEDDTGDASAAHHRLVSYNRDGIAAETNSAGFTEYKQGLDEYSLEPFEEAIFVNDFVTEDELYPYRPQERVRSDVTGIITIKLVNVPAKYSTGIGNSRGKDAEIPDFKPLVVLTHWVEWKLHRPEFDVSDEQLMKLWEESNHAGVALLNAVCSTIKETSSK